MNKLNWKDLETVFQDKSIAIIGSGPSALDNVGQFIDSHDFVVRVNNYKIRGFEERLGTKTDVHYSFYGSSIKKTVEELKRDKVKLCMCKCPNDFVTSIWHNKNRKPFGCDWRYIYRQRVWKDLPVFIPTMDHFLSRLSSLSLEPMFGVLYNGQPVFGHMPTTGFNAILDFLDLPIKSLYITGFDGFTSKIHNVNEPWRYKTENEDDPMKHRPDVELKYLRDIWIEGDKRLMLDTKLKELLYGV